MLDWCTREAIADLDEQPLALGAIVIVNANLYELVRSERAVDLVQHLQRHAVLAHDHDRIEMMRAGAQGTALLRRDV